MNPEFILTQAEIDAFCQKHHILKLSLFGSGLRHELREDSDIDLLVEFEPEFMVDLFDMAEMEIELNHMLGRKVDLRTPQELSRYFRQDVIQTAQALYEQR